MFEPYARTDVRLHKARFERFGTPCAVAAPCTANRSFNQFSTTARPDLSRFADTDDAHDAYLRRQRASARQRGSGTGIAPRSLRCMIPA
jgi:hypothetical protein